MDPWVLPAVKLRHCSFSEILCRYLAPKTGKEWFATIQCECDSSLSFHACSMLLSHFPALSRLLTLPFWAMEGPSLENLVVFCFQTVKIVSPYPRRSRGTLSLPIRWFQSLRPSPVTWQSLIPSRAIRVVVHGHNLQTTWLEPCTANDKTLFPSIGRVRRSIASWFFLPSRSRTADSQTRIPSFSRVWFLPLASKFQGCPVPLGRVMGCYEVLGKPLEQCRPVPFSMWISSLSHAHPFSPISNQARSQDQPGTRTWKKLHTMIRT